MVTVFRSVPVLGDGWTADDKSLIHGLGTIDKSEAPSRQQEADDEAGL